MEALRELIGKRIERIFYNERYLKFVTNDDDHVFTVEGDCCSTSMFYDFVGVKKLLGNGEVISVNEVELHPDDIIKGGCGMKDRKDSDEDIEVYGYAIVTKDPMFGEVTSVFSFRNYSNGYYGGWMESCNYDGKVLPEIFDDVVETEEHNDDNTL
ncbi:MAG: hypothetical protein KAJ03_01715 [Gammaproteobacteria bacterium]|nr:hypothetical protein [Gammaproteobacteria bacterium]